MTVVALTAAAGCTGTTQQQDEGTTAYTIKGTAPGNINKVYVYDPIARDIIDSTTVAGGVFALEGTADTDALLGLVTNASQGYAMFFNDGEPLTADLETTTLTGSELNTRLNAYDRAVDLLGAHSYQDAVAMIKRIISDEQQTLIPAAFLPSVVDEYELAELQELLSDDKVYAAHPMTVKARNYMKSIEQRLASVGTMFTDLEMPGTDGATHKLSDYCGKGNYVLIDFWASWCGPCRQEMPNVKANYEKYHSKGFEIVGISFDNNDTAWRRAIDSLGLGWVHLSDLKGWKSLGASTYNIRAIPSSLLVDPDGKIVAIDLGGEKLGAKLADIYGF